MSEYEIFLRERRGIGKGATAEIFEYKGFAYKCYYDGISVVCPEYEYSVMQEIGKTDLPAPRYYPTEFPNTLKMDLVRGQSMCERMLSGDDPEPMMRDLITWMQKIHKVRGLKLYSLSAYSEKQIKEGPTDEETKAKALALLEEVEATDQEPDVLCHMDFHVLNVLYEGDDVRIIDWVNAKNGRAIWEYARTYVILYEFAEILLQSFIDKVFAAEGYDKELFDKAVFVSAVCRLYEQDSERVRQLIADQRCSYGQF